MVMLRLLTWLKRDRDVVALLAIQNDRSIVSCYPDEVAHPSHRMLTARLDVESWIALLFWIAECCSVKCFLVALFSAPAEYIPALCKQLALLISFPQDEAPADHRDAKGFACDIASYLEIGYWNEQRQRFRFSFGKSSKGKQPVPSFEYKCEIKHARALSVTCWFVN